MVEKGSLRARNRENSKRSTGPRTAAGKARSSRNALNLGVAASSSQVLPDEDPSQIERLRKALWLEMKPEGPYEGMQVNRMVDGEIRRQRIERAESATLKGSMLQRRVERAHSDHEQLVESFGVSFAEYSSPMSDEERALAAFGEHDRRLRDLERTRDAEEFDIGVAMANEGEALDRFARHRTSAERSIDRAHHELLRAQADRLGGTVTPPVAIDVDLVVDRER